MILGKAKGDKMAHEYETQVLEVDDEVISGKLRKLGAKEEVEVFQKRWVYYIDENSWVRLRQVGDRTEITYKNKKGTGVSETEEIEIVVDSFEKSAELISKLKFYTEKYYQENRRKKFVLKDIEFTLDTWPRILTILEVEAKSEVKVAEGLHLLGLSGKDIGHEGMVRIYKHYSIDLHSIPKLTF